MYNVNTKTQQYTEAAPAPLISVIMPVYNAEQYIGQALQSFRAQVFKNVELLLLDAVSSDRTMEIIRQTMSQDQRIRVFCEPDNGIYEAMNKGIMTARGEWIYFMGSDDVFFNSGVLEAVAPYLGKEVDLVYGDVVWMPQGSKEKGVCTPESLVHRNINHQRVFYRKSLFAAWGGYALQYPIASDHELNIRFFCNDAIRRQYIPVTIANYHAGGFSANNIDHVFWRNWKTIFRENLAAHLPVKELYNKLGWYCRYQLNKKRYGASFLLFWDVFFHTFSFGFVLLTIRHVFRSGRN